ncbi:SlyX family protein [Massilia sp. TS11]|uniref:SlyX family protein n=1 Tax=Massilia sp. TS11 TaxID=2908003 RepID=UPI001EDC3EB5|nr:SlyX family protein [Massilia sp. TS11]MCG2585086.1 SlyX family protein [Massilia sp. TS11]
MQAEHESRLVDIELKLVAMEDLVDTLNQTVYAQSRRIEDLEALVAGLAEHVRNLAQNGAQVPLNERPPHY